ncbi:hypothetical protein L596_027099 [Steinernema carpocapsae]|uniref:Uncharacterized protein n=1 Tax=Steinernema carpocapsae TaxID=34508 RepID=A0A4U5M3D1_STECR|nr:hypothetical protein L596_027099 [Steinernema carpocapsae]
MINMIRGMGVCYLIKFRGVVELDPKSGTLLRMPSAYYQRWNDIEKCLSLSLQQASASLLSPLFERCRLKPTNPRC